MINKFLFPFLSWVLYHIRDRIISNLPAPVLSWLKKAKRIVVTNLQKFARAKVNDNLSALKKTIIVCIGIICIAAFFKINSIVLVGCATCLLINSICISVNFYINIKANIEIIANNILIYIYWFTAFFYVLFIILHPVYGGIFSIYPFDHIALTEKSLFWVSLGYASLSSVLINITRFVVALLPLLILLIVKYLIALLINDKYALSLIGSIIITTIYEFIGLDELLTK